MHAAVYSFKIEARKTKQFVESWEELTKLIYKYEGSLGSRLHKLSDEEYIAYAQWPSAAVYNNSGDNLPEEADKWRSLIRDACTQIETVYQMDMTSDLLKEDVHNS